MDQKPGIDASRYGSGLSSVRRQRWYLWGLIIVYLPATLTTLQLTQSYKATGAVFLIWLFLLCVAVTLAAIVKCPQCGNSFHMYDSTLHFPRRCRHCGLHIRADKNSEVNAI